jgi:hypothetical protein
VNDVVCSPAGAGQSQMAFCFRKTWVNWERAARAAHLNARAGGGNKGAQLVLRAPAYRLRQGRQGFDLGLTTIGVSSKIGIALGKRRSLGRTLVTAVPIPKCCINC